jgi:hypothetical protein
MTGVIAREPADHTQLQKSLSESVRFCPKVSGWRLKVVVSFLRMALPSSSKRRSGGPDVAIGGAPQATADQFSLHTHEHGAMRRRGIGSIRSEPSNTEVVMLGQCRVITMWSIVVLIVVGLGVLLTPAAATTMDPNPHIGELDERSLVTPTFEPRAISQSEAKALDVCSKPSVTPEGLIADPPECHAYSSRVNEKCCATIEETVCCGEWCH